MLQVNVGNYNVGTSSNMSATIMLVRARMEDEHHINKSKEDINQSNIAALVDLVELR